MKTALFIILGVIALFVIIGIIVRYNRKKQIPEPIFTPDVKPQEEIPNVQEPAVVPEPKPEVIAYDNTVSDFSKSQDEMTQSTNEPKPTPVKKASPKKKAPAKKVAPKKPSTEKKATTRKPRAKQK